MYSETIDCQHNLFSIYLQHLKHAVSSRNLEAKDVLYLTGSYVDGRTSGEAGNQRVRHVRRDKPKSQHTHDDLRLDTS